MIGLCWNQSSPADDTSQVAEDTKDVVPLPLLKGNDLVRQTNYVSILSSNKKDF